VDVQDALREARERDRDRRLRGRAACGELHAALDAATWGSLLAAVAPGVEGRLQARCATLFVGYLKRPSDYGVDSDLWCETGDNARMDEHGYIRITGRSKDLIIRGGENIPVVEVESLLHRHPAVEDCAVVGMPDARLGERGCAFVTLRDRDGLDFDGMLDFLGQAGLIKQYWPERLEVLDAISRR
jgi:cyclohexanecarboxylate-CoA ligase